MHFSKRYIFFPALFISEYYVIEPPPHDNSPQITRPFSVLHHAHVEFVKGSGLQV